MTQDLIGWLNSTHKEDEQDNAEGISLLLAPVMSAQPETPELPHATTATPQPDEPSQPEESPQPEEAPSVPNNDELARKITALNDAWQAAEDHDEDSERERTISPDEWLTAIDPSIALNDEQINLNAEEVSDDSELGQDSAQSLDAESEPDSSQQSPNDDTEDFDPEEHSSILNEAWHNAANLHINLNEPPQEMWADLDSDDEPKDYESRSSTERTSRKGFTRLFRAARNEPPSSANRTNRTLTIIHTCRKR